MNVTSVHSDIIASIEKLNQMLFIISGSGAGLEEKMMKQAAVQQVSGLGEHVDVQC